MSNNTPITLTHATVENDMPQVIHSYRWNRPGMTTTLNVRVDEINTRDSISGGVDTEGLKVLNARVGFNPDEVRETIDMLHEISPIHEEPPQAVNEYRRERKQQLEENQRKVKQIRKELHGESYLDRAKRWMTG